MIGVEGLRDSSPPGFSGSGMKVGDRLGLDRGGCAARPSRICCLFTYGIVPWKCGWGGGWGGGGGSGGDGGGTGNLKVRAIFEQLISIEHKWEAASVWTDQVKVCSTCDTGPLRDAVTIVPGVSMSIEGATLRLGEQEGLAGSEAAFPPSSKGSAILGLPIFSHKEARGVTRR